MSLLHCWREFLKRLALVKLYAVYLLYTKYISITVQKKYILLIIFFILIL